MRKYLISSVFAAFLFPSLAWAATADGTITAIDESTNTLTLSNGQTYQLPEEFDYSVLSNGMKVTVIYDTQGGKRYVTDIEPEGGLPMDGTNEDEDDGMDGEKTGSQTQNEAAPQDRKNENFAFQPSTKF